MNLSLSEALDRARNWERKETEVHGMMLGDSFPPWVVKFSGRVFVQGEGIVMTGENGFELTLAFVPAMTFTYNDALLEIRALGWRLCLFENKLRGTKLVPNS